MFGIYCLRLKTRYDRGGPESRFSLSKAASLLDLLPRSRPEPRQVLLHGCDRTMNSLNILSARVSPPPTPGPSRSNSFGNIFSTAGITESRKNSQDEQDDEKIGTEGTDEAVKQERDEDKSSLETSPLLEKVEGTKHTSEQSGWSLIPARISFAFVESIRWISSTLTAPIVYLMACLYDERGNFAPFSQLRGLFYGGAARRASAQASGSSLSADEKARNLGEKDVGRTASGSRRGTMRGKRAVSSNSSSSGLSSESESDLERSRGEVEQPASSSSRHNRSKSSGADEIAPARRSIRIKLHNEDSLRNRKHRKAQSTSTQSNGSGAIATPEISPAALKSPTSPASLLMTKYPRAPAPPRPLIPRRQPSYTVPEPPPGGHTQKTLILDLDETLIHSMAKGGRMSTGHMVEVNINTVVGSGSNASLAPQHPILYYVHKRPHCDDFLRRVSLKPNECNHC